MAPSSPTGRGCGLLRPTLLLGSLLLLTGAPSASWSPEETLLPGQDCELPITGGEAHGYWIEVADAPLLVTVRQLGLDLVIEDRAPGGAVSAVDTGDHSFGAEVLLLEKAGRHRVEVRPKDRFVAPGRYSISAEALSAASEEDAPRRAALSLMARAGQEAAGEVLEARRRAVAMYREALATWRTLGERRWEAETVYAIAILERDMRDLADRGSVVALLREQARGLAGQLLAARAHRRR